MAAYVARYAHAFLDVITAAGLDTTAIDGKLSDFLATWEDSPDLRAFFTNPSIVVSQKVMFLDTINGKLGMPKELRNLLAVLIKNDRIGAVSDVAAAYRKLLQDQLGICQAEVVAARELSTDERNELLAGIGKLAGGRVEATFKLDPAILGGTVVRIGSTVYDGSVRGRLERLREELTAG
jgi:F-type H+-transporting ATPase subunit delta